MTISDSRLDLIKEKYEDDKLAINSFTETGREHADFCEEMVAIIGELQEYRRDSKQFNSDLNLVDDSIVTESVLTYGDQIMSTICMEECAELIQAISKSIRGKENKESITEEIADVLICIEALKYMHGIEDADIAAWVKRKQDREVERLHL